MRVEIKRIYDEPSPRDGTRVLVDRLWPRGISKSRARLDEWQKDLAPSPSLRQWFGHEPERFDEFAKKYRRELREHEETVQRLLDRIDKRERLTLLYGARDPRCNHAAVLKEYLEDRAGSA